MWWSEKLRSRMWVHYAKVFGLYDSDQEPKNFLILHRSQFFSLESLIRHSVCLPVSQPPPLPKPYFCIDYCQIFLGWLHILKRIFAKFCGQTECFIEDSKISLSLLTRKYGKPQGCNSKTCKKKKEAGDFTQSEGREVSEQNVSINRGKWIIYPLGISSPESNRSGSQRGRIMPTLSGDQLWPYLADTYDEYLKKRHATLWTTWLKRATAFLIDLSFSSNKKSYKNDFRIHTTQRKEFCEWRQISVRFFFFNSNIDVVSFPWD